MSGDAQVRQRRKEKRKQKRDSIDQQALLKRLSLSEDEPAIGVDTAKITESEKKTVQMHIADDHDHGVGWCAKIVFFTLMAILASLVILIVLENRGGSDLDTPLSESRFSDYLQGWVDETRQDDHHDEPHVTSHDDEHDDDDGDGHDDNPAVPDDEPYPEEKDVSNPEDNNVSEELNAEVNFNESEPNESQEPNDDSQNDEHTEETKEEPTDEDDDDERGNQTPGAEETSDNDNTDEVPSLFEDSTPFEEETNKSPEKLLKGSDIKSRVDELIETFNDIAKMLGNENVTKKTVAVTNKVQIEKQTRAGTEKEDNDDDFEDVVDNDAGEDLLLQKLAEQSEAAAQQQRRTSQEDDDEPNNESSSSLGVKLGVGVLLAIVAHQIIIKKISATNRSEVEQTEIKRNEELLSKRRLTMLTASDENLIDEDLDNEEIIEVMMVSGREVNSGSEIEEEDEEYSDEVRDEYEVNERFVPKTFEDFQLLFKQQFDSDELEESPSQSREVLLAEPQSVDKEMEKRVEQELMKAPEKRIVKRSLEPETDDGPFSQEDKYERDEHDDLSDDEELVDDEEIDYEEDQEEEEEELGSEELSDIEDVDDSDLLKRLEAKYGKISGENSDEEDEDPEASWTKIPKEADEAQSYANELSKERDNLENFPHLKDLYDRAKLLDAQAEKERSNERLLEALTMYKELIVHQGQQLGNQIFKEIASRCIERMRFIGKLTAAIEIHKKLIERFDDEPQQRNQLAVTYLLGNHLSVAKLVLHEVLTRWRYNGFALVHYGFVLKNLDQDYENAALYIEEGINTDEPGTQDGRFYFNLGDALQRLGRNDEARAVFRKGAAKGLFLSEYQRSLYNVGRLKSTPFWTKVQTTYKHNLMEIQKYWQIIRDEGLKLLSEDGLFSNEAENLKETGDWKQLELYSRGQKTKYCKLAPMTCKLLESFKAAAFCKRGQVKFSVLHPNTHIFSHCGPTNCRIRCHLGLQVPEKTFIRVADKTKSWKEGDWLIFDDSFEHEVWHNGTRLRLVLIVDVWHPDLTEDEKQSLGAI